MAKQTYVTIALGSDWGPKGVLARAFVVDEERKSKQ